MHHTIEGVKAGRPIIVIPSFFLCTEAFSDMIVEANNNQRLSGISICRGSPKITHLFCANDKLLFCKVERQESQTLVEVLERYEMASGQKINADKCSIFFSQSTTPDTRREVLCTLGPMQDTRHGKYLGLPSNWEVKKPSLCGNKGEGGEKTIGLKGKNALNGWQGDLN